MKLEDLRWPEPAGGPLDEIVVTGQWDPTDGMPTLTTSVKNLVMVSPGVYQGETPEGGKLTITFPVYEGLVHGGAWNARGREADIGKERADRLVRLARIRRRRK